MSLDGAADDAKIEGELLNENLQQSQESNEAARKELSASNRKLASDKARAQRLQRKRAFLTEWRDNENKVEKWVEQGAKDKDGYIDTIKTYLDTSRKDGTKPNAQRKRAYLNMFNRLRKSLGCPAKSDCKWTKTRYLFLSLILINILVLFIASWKVLSTSSTNIRIDSTVESNDPDDDSKVVASRKTCAEVSSSVARRIRFHTGTLGFSAGFFIVIVLLYLMKLTTKHGMVLGNIVTVLISVVMILPVIFGLTAHDMIKKVQTGKWQAANIGFIVGVVSASITTTILSSCTYRLADLTNTYVETANMDVDGYVKTGSPSLILILIITILSCALNFVQSGMSKNVVSECRKLNIDVENNTMPTTSIVITSLTLVTALGGHFVGKAFSGKK